MQWPESQGMGMRSSYGSTEERGCALPIVDPAMGWLYIHRACVSSHHFLLLECRGDDSKASGGRATCPQDTVS